MADRDLSPKPADRFRNMWAEPVMPSRRSDYRICHCIGPQNGDPVCPCAMPAYQQHQAERAAWLREQRRIAEALRPAKPRVRVKAKSRPSTPEARNG